MSRAPLLLAASLLLAGVSLASAPLPPREAYVGAEGCRACHPDKYEGWQRTYHSTVVQDAKANPLAILGDFSQPGLGFKREEVEYTVGKHWTQRYMVRIGDDHFVLPKSWSIASRRWETSDAWTWKKKPYSKYCVGCHATRYDPESRTYVEHVIGCESCHGPGRRHAQTRAPQDILHPGSLGPDGQDLICASCHVRGTDPSGTYQFAVGYVPGRNLEEHYVPHNALDDEPPRAALLRLFRGWQEKVRSGSAECEVCGINGEKGKKQPATLTEYCMGCHKFGDGYAAHTRHKMTLGCLDCHRKVELETPAEGEDVHSLGYFLVHNRTCYDREFTQACAACHVDFSAGQVNAVLHSWRRAERAVHD